LTYTNGTRKEDGIPPVGIKVLREREKRLLLDFIRDNLKQPKKRRKEWKIHGIWYYYGILIQNTI